MTDTIPTSVDTKIPFYKTKMFLVVVGIGVLIIIIVVAVALTRPATAITCTRPQVLKDGKCVVPAIQCISPRVLKDGKCVLQCTSSEELVNDKCVTLTPTCTPPKTLQSGVCVTPPVTCTSPQILQSGVCVTPTSTCTSPQTLQNGVCVTPTSTCTSPQTLQNGVCVTPTPTCTSPQILQNGVCVTPTPTCTSPQILQSGVCVTPIVKCAPYLYNLNNVCFDSLELLKSDFGNPSMCVSTRRLSKSYAGFCVRVVDKNNKITNIGFDSKGMIDYEIFRTLVEPVHIIAWYDQSGLNRNLYSAFYTEDTQPGFYDLLRDYTPKLTFEVLGGVRRPNINFANNFMCTNPGTERGENIVTFDTLGLNNPVYQILSSIRTSSVNNNIQFIYSSKIPGVNEMHLNGASGIRVLDINHIVAEYADIGVSGQYSDTLWHYILSGVDSNRTAVSVDGSETKLTPSTLQQLRIADLLYIGMRGSKTLDTPDAFPFFGNISEFIIFPSSWRNSNSALYKLYVEGLKNYNNNGYS